MKYQVSWSVEGVVLPFSDLELGDRCISAIEPKKLECCKDIPNPYSHLFEDTNQVSQQSTHRPNLRCSCAILQSLRLCRSMPFRFLEGKGFLFDLLNVLSKISLELWETSGRDRRGGTNLERAKRTLAVLNIDCSSTQYFTLSCA